MDSQARADFETAMGEAFADAVCPPVPFELASAHECCEVLWEVVGPDVTPAALSALPGAKLQELAAAFGRYFECPPPSIDQIGNAISRTLARWPT
ncbi:hypothetical protein [Inquilinus sp. CA228]|uniref:hypothetical protein n=1 Tax=Inquilinus sp. CA228 TaxID=3455609 RepID=UPI003F8D673F